MYHRYVHQGLGCETVTARNITTDYKRLNNSVVLKQTLKALLKTGDVKRRLKKED